jgi:hypothetical protein
VFEKFTYCPCSGAVHSKGRRGERDILSDGGGGEKEEEEGVSFIDDYDVDTGNSKLLHSRLYPSQLVHF